MVLEMRSRSVLNALLFSMLHGATLAAAISVLSVGTPVVLPLARPASVFTEMPPTILRVPGDLPPGRCPAVAAGAMAVYLSTAYVGLCIANASTLNVAAGAPPLGFLTDTCSVPFSGESWRSWPPAAVPAHSEWFRNYDGVFSVVPMATGTAEAALLLVRHGEHKNELCWANNLLYQGLINPEVDARTCFSGLNNGTFSDCQPAYNAFVSGAVVAMTAATCYGLGPVGNASTVDLGPLAWPTGGYLNSTGGKVSYGVRQPGAILGWDNATYIFWIDNDFERADVWAARSVPGANQGAPATFFSYDHTAAAWSLPTLPDGFELAQLMSFLRSRSPAGATGRGAPLFPLYPTAGSVHVAAARLTSNGAPTPYHLVVYDIVNYTQCWPPTASSHEATEGSARPAAHRGSIGTRIIQDMQAARSRTPRNQRREACVPIWRIFLRTTLDFVTFSEPVELSTLAAPGWPAALLQYPVLLSGDGARQDEVDATGFYVLGTCAASDAPCGSTYGPQVTAVHVTISVDAHL